MSDVMALVLPDVPEDMTGANTVLHYSEDPVFENTQLTNATKFIVPRKVDPAVSPSGESYVVFATNKGCSLNAQAQAWAKELAAFPEWPTGSAAIYNVLNRQNNIVAVVKLRRNGHMYAPVTNATYTITNGVRLQFKQWLPENEILTPPPAMYGMQMRSAIETATTNATRAIVAALRAKTSV